MSDARDWEARAVDLFSRLLPHLSGLTDEADEDYTERIEKLVDFDGDEPTAIYSNAEKVRDVLTGGLERELNGDPDDTPSVGDRFERLISAVASLEYTNAEHKKGWRMARQEPRRALIHALEEIGEAIEADAYGEPDVAGLEVMDAAACLVHFCIKRGLRIAELLRWWVEEKLPRDFPKAGPLLPRCEQTSNLGRCFEPVGHHDDHQYHQEVPL